MKPQVLSKNPEITSDQILGEGRRGHVIRRWRSSLWKLLWLEYIIYVVAFLTLSLIYRFGFPLGAQEWFENLIRFIRTQTSGVPLTFLLGFYVSLVVGRWWSQYCALPWPDNVATFLAGVKAKDGTEEDSRMTRRTIMRYCLLSYVLCIRRLSIKLRKKFPTMKEVVDTGLVTEEEAERVGSENCVRQHGVSNWWLPLQWASEIAHNDEDISGAGVYALLLLKITAFRESLTEVLNYGHVPIPLVYTQVVTIAVRIYFVFELIGAQWIVGEHRQAGDEQVDLYYPIFLSIKFMFYLGWLRVAETLYNPFGEDDDDFALEELLNRHIKVAMSIVDKTEAPPPVKKDKFWGQEKPKIFDVGCTENHEDYDHSCTPEKIELITHQEKRDPMI